MTRRVVSAGRILEQFLNEQLPARFPIIRDERPDDLARVLRWLKAGRAEGAFQPGPPPNARAIADYRRRIAGAGWVYRCWIIEKANGAIGYMDARTKGTAGEVLGIYLDRSARGLRLGRHLMRWAIAALRQQGCRKVAIEVYADNSVSLRACHAAGFTRDPARDRYEAGRLVLTLRRPISPFVRLTQPDSRYAILRGENLFLHHVAVAEALSERFMTVPGVAAVLGLGSLWRGFGDELSDIDIAILGHGAPIDGLRTGEHFVLGTSLDVFAVDLDRSPPLSWNQSRRQAFEEAVVLARHPDWKPHSLRRAVSLRASERRARISECLLSLGWIGYHPEAWTGGRRYGYMWEVPHDAWLRRGSIDSAHATVDKALDLTLQLLFLANRRHVPDPKWRLFLAPGVPWRPRGFAQRLRAVVSADRDVSGFHERARAVRRIVASIAARLEKEGAIDHHLYARFLEGASDYAVT